MSISIAQVERVAKLARITLTDDEKQRLCVEMEAIIEFADKLNELDATGILPTTHAVPIENIFREDERTGSFDRDVLLKNAAEQDGTCFLVPRAVEEG